MVNALVDTTVVVDLLREFSPAESWYREQIGLGIVPIVWLEVLEGSTNKRDQIRAVKLLSSFELVDLTPADMNWSVEALLKYGLSHNVSGFDCVIASAAMRLHIPIYTSNIKHFQQLVGELAQKPY